MTDIKMLESFGIVAFLGFNSWQDIRKREISLWTVIILILAGTGKAVYLGKTDLSYLVAIGIGAGIILLSLISGGAVGIGDGLIMIALGAVLPFDELCGTFFAGLLCSCLWGIILLILPGTGRKTQMPFVPFLLLGYIGGLIY